jgi:leader peptidase (prepilin peptidase) / N-methyltransferase
VTTAALIVGCVVAGAAIGAILPVAVVASPDGRTVADGPRPMPSVVVHRWWGRAMMAAAAAIWAGFAARLGAAWDLPAYLVLGAGLVTLTVIDLRHQLLPRRVVFPVGAATVALLGVAAIATDGGNDFLRAVACAAGAYLAFGALRFVNPRALGGGDVTLAGLLGLSLGWFSVTAAITGLAVGAVLAALFAVVALATGRIGRSSALTYGPFLVAGALLVLYAAPDGRLFG